jgi:hypothetical protein
MEISGIIFIEDGNTHWLYLYKEGSFWKAYERSAYRFVKNIRAYQTKLRYYKNIGREIISIGFPDIALSGILKDFKPVLQSDTQVTIELEDEIVLEEFLSWKSEAAGQVKPARIKQEPSSSNAVLEAVRSFSVANKTPLECMQFISGLQNQL